VASLPRCRIYAVLCYDHWGHGRSRRVTAPELVAMPRALSERLAGYMDAIAAQAKARIRPIVFESKGIAFADGLAIGRELFTKKNRPSAIQCMTDDMAAGLIAAAHERRLGMPETMSIAGFDNFGLATRIFPALSTATLPLMAMAATRQVRDAIEGKEVAPLLPCPCELVLRDSSGAA